MVSALNESVAFNERIFTSASVADGSRFNEVPETGSRRAKVNKVNKFHF
jgi:hypothetical protein